MTVKQLAARLNALIEQNEREKRPEYNDLEVWVSFQQSPRRKVYLPIEAVWGGCLTIPVPDNNSSGYKDKVQCVEARADIRDKVTGKG